MGGETIPDGGRGLAKIGVGDVLVRWAPEATVGEVHVPNLNAVKLSATEEEVEAEVGGTSEVGINLVKDVKVIRVEPELAMLLRGGSLLSTSCSGAKGKIEDREQSELLSKLEGCQ